MGPHPAQADAKRLPAAIFNCTTKLGASAAPVQAPAEAIVAELDNKPSLLDSSDAAGGVLLLARKNQKP